MPEFAVHESSAEGDDMGWKDWGGGGTEQGNMLELFKYGEGVNVSLDQFGRWVPGFVCAGGENRSCNNRVVGMHFHSMIKKKVWLG